MNLRQLRSLCAIIDHNLKISEAADAVFLTQSGVTRQIQDLERELGVDLFVRRRNRILQVTPDGRRIAQMARRVLSETDNLQRAAKEASGGDCGEFTIATTHTQARYTLPAVVRRFIAKYPGVRLTLRQGTPAQCCELVASGKADLAISTEIAERFAGVVQIPCYRLNRSLVMPPGHPLLRVKPLSLKAISAYPLISFDEGFSAQWKAIARPFNEAGLTPSVVMSAIDADVSKSYVEVGLGIAILTSITFDPKRDTNLRAVDVRHLFEPSWLSLVVRVNSFFRRYMFDFVQMFSPKLPQNHLERVLAGEAVDVDRLQLPAM